MKIEKLADIISRLQGKDYGNLLIKRAIAKAAKGFRPRSPNDIEHRSCLAICLYFVGDTDNAKAILHAIDREAADVSDFADQLGELAKARLLLAHLYKEEGKVDLRDEIMSRDGIKRCANMENMVGDNYICFYGDYENGLQEFLSTELAAMHSEESQLETKREQQIMSYCTYVEAVIYTERFEEIRDKVSKEDEANLAKALVSFRDDFIYLLNS